MGYEDGGVFPLAASYLRSEVGNSDHNLPEHVPPEIPEALLSDDVSGNGVFDGANNSNVEYGAFADNVSMPGYAARENGMGPSETIDWQTGTPVEVFASGLFNNVADQGVYPNTQGAQYLANKPWMAATDFATALRSVPTYNDDQAMQRPVSTERGPLTEAAVSGYGAYAEQAAAGYGAYGNPALVARQLVPVGRPGVMDLVAYRGVGADEGGGGFALPELPTWQWAALGVFAGGLIGAGLAVAFPKKG